MTEPPPNIECGEWQFGAIIHRPAPWLNLNRPGHHMPAYRHAQDWKQATLVATREYNIPRHLGQSILLVTFQFKTDRTRDPGNFEPTTKACVDFLTKQHHCWDDDSPQYLTYLPATCRVRKGMTEALLISAWRRP